MTDGARIPTTLRDVGESETPDGVYVIGLRETTADESWSLLLMAYDEDDQDEPGMDTYCLVVNPGQATYYGGVLECRITGTELRLRFAAEAADILELPADLRFGLELTAEQHQLVELGLTRVFTSGRPDAHPAVTRD
jgi:hypothetical protein